MKKVLFLLCLSFCSVVVHSQWVNLNPGLEGYTLNSVFFTNDVKGYIACDRGIVLKTIDGGVTWDSIPTEINYTIRSVYFANQDTGIIVGGDKDYLSHNGYIWISTDGGNTWSYTNQLLYSTVFNSVFFYDTQRGYVVGDYSTIMQTTDGGKNWKNVYDNYYGEFYSVFFTSPDVGYAVGGAGTILTTNNGGSDWNDMNSNTSNDLYSVYFPSPSIGYAVGSHGTILKNNHGAGSIEEKESAASSYSLYPNPADTKITIVDKKKMPGETDISICGVNGDILMRFRIKDLNKVELDVSTLLKGVYMIKIQTGSEIEVKKLVIG